MSSISKLTHFSMKYHACNMSYLDLKSFERDKLVSDYQKTLENLRKRHENNHRARVFRERELEQTFKPVIKSQQNMAEKIVNQLRETRETREPVVKLENRKKRKLEKDDFGPLATRYRNRYMNRDPTIDTSFGINFLENGNPVIARTPIKIENDDILIYDEVYEGTPGLWELLTEKNKQNLRSYTQDDLVEYAKILHQTNVLYEDFNPETNYPRSNSSWKWKNLLSPIWRKLNEAEDDEEVEGEGIFVHPLGNSKVILKTNGKSFVVKTKGQGLKLKHICNLKLKDGVYVRNGNRIYDGKCFKEVRQLPVIKHFKF